MKRPISLVGSVLVLAMLAACGASATATVAPTIAPTRAAAASAPPAAASAAASSTSASAAPATPSRASGPLKKLTIGLGYIPDIQFAPFYVAQAKGYFRDEGLDVDFKQGFETDVLKLLGTGALNFGVAGGDELMVARSQGVPIVYVATWFQKYPVSIVAPESANIRAVADLKGKTIGVPGRFGATYVGLLALLDSAGLKESDVQLREIGFTQVQALTQKQVDAVVGYSNNEPVQLKALGLAITTFNVFDKVDLVSNGLITDEKTAQQNPELVRSVVRAFLRGVQDTIGNPEEAITLSIPTIPGSADKRDQLRAVLAATVPIFQSTKNQAQGLGYSDPAAWTSSRDLLRKLGVLGSDIDVSKAYTNAFLPKP
jgi:NitT/TauT family transport system substrate-binding protein